jgi:cytochrome c oxidase subunit III
MPHTLSKTSALREGILIFVYLAVLTGLEFFVALTFASVPFLIVVALIKAALVGYYYMHIYKLNLEQEDDRHSYEYKTGTNRFGLWLFLLSDSFVFGGLMVARINLLGLNRPHLNQLLGLFVTSILLISSFFMNRGETAMAHGDRRGFLLNTGITLLMGLGFLLGVVGVEWPLAAREGLTPASNAAGAVFYMMTGMHAFHVLTGLILLTVILNKGRKNYYSAEKHWAVEAGAVYWHFVDVVWIFFYPALYLIGRLL